MWWWNTFGLLLIACLLIAKALRGTYIGDEPRCKKCKYELTGITSSNCPECGNIIDVVSVIYGKKHILWRWLLLALIVPLFWQSSIDSLAYLPGINWDHYSFTATLLENAKNNDESAIDEIMRRIETNPPASRYVRKITSVAISKHKQWPLGKFTDKWTTILEELEKHGLLNQHELDQIFTKYACAKLESRARIRQGDYVALRLSYTPVSGGMNGYKYWQEPLQVSLRDDVIYETTGDEWRNRWPDWYRSDTSPLNDTCFSEKISMLEPGIYNVKYTGRHVMMHRQHRREQIKNHPPNNPSWTKDFSLESTIEIFDRNDKDPVSWIEKPELQEQLQRAISVRTVDDLMWWPNIQNARKARPPDRTWDYVIISVISRGNIDVPIAFNFFVKVNGKLTKALPWGHSRFRARDRDRHSLVSDKRQRFSRIFRLKIPRLDSKQVEIVLRSSKELARQTVDIYKVWHGSLTYGPFNLEFNEQENDDFEASKGS